MFVTISDLIIDCRIYNRHQYPQSAITLSLLLKLTTEKLRMCYVLCHMYYFLRNALRRRVLFVASRTEKIKSPSL